MSTIQLADLPGRFGSQARELHPSPTLNAEDPQHPPAQASPLPRPANPNFLSIAFRSFSSWWHSWVSRTITHGSGPSGGDPRDYLALERTFLGWVRTSLALISLAVVVTQLFVFKNLDRTKGIVLGCILTSVGMAIVIGAAVRYFRAQELLVRGKALTGGWEAIGLWGLLVLVVGALFIVVLVDD